MFYNNLTDNSLVNGISDLGSWIGNGISNLFGTDSYIPNSTGTPIINNQASLNAMMSGYSPTAAAQIGGSNLTSSGASTVANNGISNTTDGLGLNMGTFKTGLDLVQGIGSLYGAWSQNKLAKQALNQAKNQFYYNMAQDAKNFNAAAKTYNNDLAQKYETAAVQNTGNSHAYDDKIADRRVTG